MPFQYGPGVELSSFRHLLNLAWKGLRPQHLKPLCIILRNNATQLKSLELDFLSLIDIFSNNQDGQDDSNSGTSGDASDGEVGKSLTGVKKSSFFASIILDVDSKSPSLLFPNIRVLSLSQVPLTRSLASVFNFDTLVSLKLRLCSCWDVFIRRVLKLNRPIKLKTLEIQDSDAVSDDLGHEVILDFVNAFAGLEELFVCHPGPISALELWEIIASRHTTLKRLACHQTTVGRNLESPAFSQVCDLADLGICGRDMRRIKKDPSKNPLSELDLEFIGLACIPERMKYLLLPFASKTSLKAIHIRHTMSDIWKRGSWALGGGRIPMKSRATSNASSDSDLSITEELLLGFDQDELEWHNPRLRSGFRHFAEWAFGPEGISSLDIIAYGDFAYGGRRVDGNVLLGRQTGGTSHFRVLNEKAGEWKDALDKYHVAMGTCPAEHLFHS
ncbi:hypothetical protein N0V84_001457 [Fusarium piperis]|uniref:Uncharacterized protein n=1 Tax=Fusarium piperis TaxID=1435070 RepID=A0A9W8WL14_9HYPO|nr:hypothetical protein N0V84_001457 [Fusarium piperis]